MGKETQLHDYSTGVAHYLSPARRDAVKLFWEEPYSQNIYSEVFRKLFAGRPYGWVPSILDLGCGTGDGLRLRLNPRFPMDGNRNLPIWGSISVPI